MTDEELARLVASLRKLGVEDVGDMESLRSLMESPAATCTMRDGESFKMPLLPPAGDPVIAIEVEEFHALFFIPVVE